RSRRQWWPGAVRLRRPVSATRPGSLRQGKGVKVSSVSSVGCRGASHVNHAKQSRFQPANCWRAAAFGQSQGPVQPTILALSVRPASCGNGEGAGGTGGAKQASRRRVREFARAQCRELDFPVEPAGTEGLGGCTLPAAPIGK